MYLAKHLEINHSTTISFHKRCCMSENIVIIIKMSEYNLPGRCHNAEYKLVCVWCTATAPAPSPSTKRYLKPKLKTVSTKLSEFPHNTSYHASIQHTARRYGPRPHSWRYGPCPHSVSREIRASPTLHYLGGTGLAHTPPSERYGPCPHSAANP